MRNIIRTFASFGIFVMVLLVMLVVCTLAWDAFVNGKLYLCTDGGAMDFICVGDWVHHPDTVTQIVPHSMSEPDEIKQGWSMAGLWGLWVAFAFVAVMVSGLLAGVYWHATRPLEEEHRLVR
jgi:hypothetical protein